MRKQDFAVIATAALAAFLMAVLPAHWLGGAIAEVAPPPSPWPSIMLDNVDFHAEWDREATGSDEKSTLAVKLVAKNPTSNPISTSVTLRMLEQDVPNPMSRSVTFSFDSRWTRLEKIRLEPGERRVIAIRPEIDSNPRTLVTYSVEDPSKASASWDISSQRLAQTQDTAPMIPQRLGKVQVLGLDTPDLIPQRPNDVQVLAAAR